MRHEHRYPRGEAAANLDSPTLLNARRYGITEAPMTVCQQEPTRYLFAARPRRGHEQPTRIPAAPMLPATVDQKSHRFP
jgi:hypothetical protein